MAVKLIVVSKQLNIGIATISEWCKKHGITIGTDPNYRIDDDLYARLINELPSHKQNRLVSIPTPNFTSKEEIISASDDEIRKFFSDTVFEGVFSKEIKSKKKDAFNGHIKDIRLNGQRTDIVNTYINVPVKSNDIPEGPCSFKCWMNIEAFREDSSKYFVNVDGMTLIALEPSEDYVSPTHIDNLTEKDLFEIWGLTDRELIGYYHAKEDYFIVDDLRKTNFDHIPYYPGDEDKRPIELYVPKPLPGLEPDNYYIFTWKLSNNKPSNPYEIWIDYNYPPKRIEPSWFVNKLFNDRYEDKSRNFGSTTNFLDTLSKQLSAKESTFIYELLQNANDYPKGDEPVDVEFHILDKHLIFMHSGDYFNVRNISGICGINEKEKAANKKAIGYKGIGFKTVFLNNHYVYIKTGAYSFRFDKSEQRPNGIIKRLDAPWQVLPIWTEPSSLNTEVANSLKSADSKFRVQIALRPDSPKVLHEGRNCYENIFKEIFEDSNIILFIPHIRSVKVYINDALVRDCKRNNTEWVVNDYEENIDEELIQYINKTIDTGKSRIPEKYKDFEATRVSFACKHQGRELIPINRANLYCYLPTKASWGFPFLMNTDMIPKGDRNDIETEVNLVDEEETNFNLELAKIAGRQFFYWIRDLIMSGKYDYESIFRLVPDFDKCINEHEDYEEFITNFKNGFEELLEEEPLVPIVESNKIVYKKVEDIIYDTTGLSCTGLMPDEEILSRSEWSDYFPHPTLRDYSNADLKPAFKAFMETYHSENQEYDIENLVNVVELDGFQSWLEIQHNNNEFLKLLVKKDIIDNFEQSNIFIANDDSLCAPDDLYYDVTEYYDDISYLDDYLTRLSEETKQLFVNSDVWDNFISNFKTFDPDHFVDEILLERSNFSNVHEILMEGNASVKFMDFLSKNVGYSNRYQDFPFVDVNGDVIENFKFNNFIYLPNSGAELVREKPWVNSNHLAIISPAYSESSMEYLRKYFNIVNFDTQSFIEQYVCSDDYTEDINDCIQEWGANKDFVEYLFANQAYIHDGQLRPYYVSSVDADGDESFYLIEDTYLYLPDPKGNIKYESLSWVDDGMFVLVREDYFNSANKTKLTQFFEKKFEIPILDMDAFVHVVLDEHVDEVNNYIMENEAANMSFWKWVKEQFSEQEKISPIFQKFPVLAKSLEDEGYDYYTAEEYNIYLSSAYQIADDVEKIVSRYVPDTLFVASYMESETKANIKSWVDFWGKVGIQTTIKELVLNRIIYCLDEIQEDGLPNLLGQHYADIQEVWDDVKSSLLNIQLKTRGGEFLSIHDVVVIDVNKEKEPFENIIIDNEVEPASIGNRNTQKLLIDIAHEANSRMIKNITEWQQYKITAYAGNEEKYSDDVHIAFVKELAQIDIETIKSFDGIEELRLQDRTGHYLNPSELTLGSLYKPDFDFETFGVEYKFISEKYYASDAETALKSLIKKGVLNVHSQFTVDDIRLLSSYDLSLYFWKDYIRNHHTDIVEWIDDDLFRDVECVPTMDKSVSAPNKIYARSISDYVANKIRNWEGKLPSDQIPRAKDASSDLFDKLPFKDHLSIEDSLDALLNIKAKERRSEILSWMYEEYSSEYESLISSYRSNPNAVWKNGKGQDMPLTNLLALSPDSKKLYEFFRDNENVIHGLYLPPTYQAENYRGICAMMQIPIIEEDDMEFEPVDCVKEQLNSYFEGRLLIVAAIEEPLGWKKLFAKFKEKINTISFRKCSKIAWVYTKNNAIQQSNKRFFYDNVDFYYVDSWFSRQVFGYLVDAIRDFVNSDLNEDQFRDIMDPDSTTENILENYYSIRTDEFIAELKNYDTEYHTDIVQEEEDENEDVDSTYQPKLVDYPTSVEDGSEITDDEDNLPEDDFEEPQDDGDDTINMPPKHTSKPIIPKGKTMIAGPGEEVVSGHYRSGAWVDGYYKSDGTYVSGHYRSDSIVSEHTRDIPETTRTSSSHASPSETPSRTTRRENDDRDTENPNSSTTTSRQPRNSNWKREPHNFTEDELNNMRSKGTPLELTALPPTDEEIEVLGQCGIAPEHISDSNYIAQLRLYQNLKDHGDEPVESLEDFIRNSDDVTEHKMLDGKYIHTCSAARGVMYVSPSIWNKVMDDKCKICVYYGPHANQFFYISTPEDLMKLVEKDDVVIKITGQEKVNVVGALYNGLLKGVTGTAYTLIRIAAHTDMDAVFARYVGKMKDSNDNDDSPLNLEEY